MKVAVFGVTGLVGTVMLEVLAERGFPVTELVPIASERSAGRKITFGGRQWEVVTPEVGLGMRPDVALFSAGGGVSLEWAPRFAEAGCRVVDNSSAWRMDPTKKLIVPEINGNVLTENDFIVANPNCSTIQMLMAVAPLYREFGVKRIVVSTYQGITGSGVKAVNQMDAERAGRPLQAEQCAYPYPIDKNCLPHCDSFTENGYTKEEMKLITETHKILDDQSIAVSPTAVRVPVVGGHSESVNVEFRRPYTMDRVRELLANMPGVVVQDDPGNLLYPMARAAHGHDQVFVGRIRADIFNPMAINMWVVSDNLRKGAATNAIQIAELLVPFITHAKK